MIKPGVPLNLPALRAEMSDEEARVFQKYQDGDFSVSNGWRRCLRNDYASLATIFVALFPALLLIGDSVVAAVTCGAYQVIKGPLRELVRTPEHRALAHALNAKMIYFLVREIGCDINDNAHGTPSFFSYMVEPMIDAAVECGANIELQDRHGDTFFVDMCLRAFEIFPDELIMWFVEKHMPMLRVPNRLDYNRFIDNSRYTRMVEIYEARVAKCQRAVLYWMYRAGRAAAGPNRDVVRLIGEEIWASRRSAVWEEK